MYCCTSNQPNPLTGLVQRVEASIYTPVAPLQITGWVTAEPAPFEQRTSGVETPMAVGQAWGRRLFDCAWMRFRCEVPAAAAELPLVVRIDINGELCLVDHAGVPVRGLTCVRSRYDVANLGIPGKTVYRLPADALEDRVLELWGDAGLNDLFGFMREGGIIVLAEIATWREDVRQLYYDLEVLHDYLNSLPPDSHLAAGLQSVIAAIAEDLDCAQPASVTQARERLRPWFESADKPRLQVHAIGHAHIDLAWRWPIRETIRKGARTFATVLYNLERYPEYVFGCSQPQLFVWIREHHPELYRRVKAAVLARRIEPQGAFWVEPDCNMPSGESFVRQILHGARFFHEEFGVEPDYCWEPDVFGYHGQLPQILRRSGHKFFMTQKLSWNAVNRFPHHSFQWEGIDGSVILAHMLPEETYNGPAAPRSLRKIGDEYAERDVSDHALMVFGIGDGGGGPDAEHMERLRRATGLPGLPAVKIESTAQFFETWSRQADRFPRWKGELYLERHQGTLTTQARTKRYNRQTEVLLREVEWAAFLAHQAAGMDYPGDALDRLWKEALLYQFHDVLPGSSIKRVYDECYPRYEAIIDELTRLKDTRYATVAAHLAQTGAVAFNSLSWPRTEWVRHEETWRRVEVPAFGLARLPGTSAEFTPPIATDTRLENEHLRADFAPDGRIRSLLDKRTQREVLAAGETGNRFIIYPDKGDAWDFEADKVNKDVWIYLRQEPSFPTLRSCKVWVDGPCAAMEQAWAFGQSEIRQTIRLLSGAGQLDFKTEVDWREEATMLRVQFPVAVRADEARFEIPFGSIRRSTLEDTSERRAQIEVAMLQWLDLSQDDCGVTLLNDCKYGCRVKGHTIDLTLIRSVPYPGGALIGKEDVANTAVRGGYTDLGRHQFRYALLPHAGPGDIAAITKAAREFNTPLPIHAVSPSRASQSAAPISAFRISNPAIELAAIKPAENGDGWIARLVNLTDLQVESVIDLPEHRGPVLECDLMERNPAATRSDSTGRTQLHFGPFEIKTLRWTASGQSGGSARATVA